MPTLYNILLLLHILAVVAWVGSVVTIGTLSALCVAKRDHAALALLLRVSGTFGPAVSAPAAVVTLIAGMAMMGVAGLEPDLWMMWGFGSIVLSLIVGGVFIRPAVAQAMRLAEAPAGNSGLPASERRLVLLNGLNALLLISAIFAMVLKPTF